MKNTDKSHRCRSLFQLTSDRHPDTGNVIFRRQKKQQPFPSPHCFSLLLAQWQWGGWAYGGWGAPEGTRAVPPSKAVFNWWFYLNKQLQHVSLCMSPDFPRWPWGRALGLGGPAPGVIQALEPRGSPTSVAATILVPPLPGAAQLAVAQDLSPRRPRSSGSFLGQNPI